MTGLLYKNFKINFYSFIVMIVTSLILSASAVIICLVFKGRPDFDIPALLIMLSYYSAFIMPSMLSSFLFEADEGRAKTSFAMAIPQGAKGHIESKYLFILIQNLIVLFIAFLIDTVIYGIMDGQFTCTTILMFIFCWRLLISAIEIPFVIRFGAQKGVVIKSMVIVLVIALGIIYFLFGDITWLINSDDPLRAFIEWIQSGKFMFPLSLFPMISIAAYYLSCRISVKVFRKGAENYEQ